MLTKVRQLFGNQKLTANRYQKLTANCYQKLTAKCYQKFQTTVDSEMLSKVSVKSRHQKFQSKVDTESFSQKLTAKCNAKIVREVALRYCKQINNGRYQCNTHPVIFPAKSQPTHHSQAHTTQRRCEEYFWQILVILSDGCMIINEIIKRYTRLGSSSWQHCCFGCLFKNVKIVISRRAPGRWCHVILIVVKTKQRSRDPKT